MMRFLPLIIIAALLQVPAALAADHSAPSPVPVDYFFELGCESCGVIKRDVLPELEQRYSGYYELHEWDVGIKSNYLKLVEFQERLGVKDNEPVSMVVDNGVLLAGLARIKKDVIPELESAIARRITDPSLTSEGPGSGAAVVPAAGSAGVPAGEPLLKRRVENFTLAGIVSAAAVDSINPCAISTLVFFMSLLSVMHIGTRRMLLAGMSFLAACFVTYLGIGFGLLRLLQCLTAFRVLRLGIEMSLMVVMIGFAFISFRDALRFYRSGRPGDVALKLPEGIQKRIHKVMRDGLRKRSLILGGIGIGVAVTLLESVCTGQVYLPALVMMIKSGQSVLRCVVYLLLYNVIFVLPLAVVLVLTCRGMSTTVLIEWSRRNVVVSKTLLGVFFLAMTVLMIVLR